MDIFKLIKQTGAYLARKKHNERSQEKQFPKRPSHLGKKRNPIISPLPLEERDPKFLNRGERFRREELLRRNAVSSTQNG